MHKNNRGNKGDIKTLVLNVNYIPSSTINDYNIFSLSSHDETNIQQMDGKLNTNIKFNNL